MYITNTWNIDKEQCNKSFGKECMKHNCKIINIVSSQLFLDTN